MGSVVDSLKRLYKKIGGGKLKGPIAIDDLVDKIADQMSSGGSGGSTASVLLVNATVDAEDENLYTLDKTWNEIKQAYTNGSTVLVHWPEFMQQGDHYSSVINVQKLMDSPPNWNYYIYVTGDYDIAFNSEDVNGYPQYYKM